MTNIIKKILHPLIKIKPLYAIWMSSKSRHDAKHAFSENTPPAILIYQMGKVASTSIFATLRNSGITNPIENVIVRSD